MEYYAGKNIKSKKLQNVNLEVIYVDNLLEECTCIELNSHDVKRYKVNFDDVLEG